MKSKKKYSAYFQKRISNIDRLKKKATYSFSPSDFHSLRVEIKKTKAVLEFIQFYNSDFKKKQFFNDHKNIFKSAGKIRDIQVEEDHIEKRKKRILLKNYSRRLKVSKQKKINIFLKEINEKPDREIKRNNSKILKVLNKATEEDAANYIRDRKKKIGMFFGKKKIKKKKVHVLRKELKELFYYTKMLGANESRKSKVKIDHFQELLGEWHDKKVILKHLKETLKYNKKNESELKELTKLRSDLISERNMLFGKIKKIMEGKVFRQ